MRVQGVWLEIGENTRENIYTPQQQKHWLDQPEGKSGSINSVQKLQKIIKGYAAALEEKEKRAGVADGTMNVRDVVGASGKCKVYRNK